MALAYYRRLDQAQRRIYDRSDEFTAVRLNLPVQMRPLVRGTGL